MLPIGPSNPQRAGFNLIYSSTQLSKDFAIVLPAAEMECRPFTGWPDRGVQVAFEVKGTVPDDR
jgi:hypothetical protein